MNATKQASWVSKVPSGRTVSDVTWMIIECADQLMRQVYEGSDTESLHNIANELYAMAQQLGGRTNNDEGI